MHQAAGAEQILPRSSHTNATDIMYSTIHTKIEHLK